MKRMIRSECYRAFTSKGFFLSVAIGVIITLVYFFHYVLPVDLELLVSGYNGKTDPEYPGVLYNLWFGGRYPCAEKQLFFLVLPLLAALPFADSYFQDLRGGYIYNVCLRTDKKHYFAAKYLAVFLSGGTAVTLPLLANFLLCSMFLPSMKPEVTNAHILVYSSFPHLFFSYPVLYVLLYLAIIFVFSGLLACFGLYATRHLGYAFLVLLAPFAVYLFISSGLNLIGGLELYAWQPLKFLDPAFERDAKWAMLVEGGLLLVVTLVGFVIRQPRRDVLN